MSFEGIRGQEAAVRLLRAALWHERVGSGYLFFGPEGVGKAETASAFARAILCPERERSADACGTCAACVRSGAGSHPGLLTVEIQPGRTRIRISQIQDLGRRLSLRPIEGERTVAVVPGVEKTNIEGLNALLKTLEEPPPGTTIVLLTANPEFLPDTIRSRCQGVRFRPLSRALVVERLVASGIGDEPAERLATLSAGSVPRALRLAKMGFPDRLGDLLGRLTDPVADPVEASRDWKEMLTGGTREDVRGRVRDLLSLMLELAREGLTAGTERPRDAGFCFDALVRGLDNLRLNVTADAALTATLVEILPRWPKTRAT